MQPESNEILDATKNNNTCLIHFTLSFATLSLIFYYPKRAIHPSNLAHYNDPFLEDKQKLVFPGGKKLCHENHIFAPFICYMFFHKETKQEEHKINKCTDKNVLLVSHKKKKKKKDEWAKIYITCLSRWISPVCSTLSRIIPGIFFQITLLFLLPHRWNWKNGAHFQMEMGATQKQ